ncbi:SND2/TMEM208 family protein [Methanobrevibacter curvatus]|uniref:Energy-converting hydrogenase A subunit I n=1 Tax=Methanobrevibacter curvatus TaxID=49547 RepID=A0A166AXC4_9EURY|nr:SND2/TMEM208 family protein [Methanobrevibacter curvatus]KZX12591.1 hypothetical protein MBCUR_10020 [Methanobrevibacter curvatus]
MNKLNFYSYLFLIISTIMLLYGLIFNPNDWIVYTIAIIFIPLFILSLGFITMAKPKKEDEEERVQEPFIGF